MRKWVAAVWRYLFGCGDEVVEAPEPKLVFLAVGDQVVVRGKPGTVVEVFNEHGWPRITIECDDSVFPTASDHSDCRRLTLTPFANDVCIV